MKTTVTLLAAFGTFAAFALAGPGPQYWNKSATTAPAAKPAASACGGCSGKGVAGSSLASRTHGCTSCNGTIVSSPGHTADTMTRAAACGTMMCCK